MERWIVIDVLIGLIMIALLSATSVTMVKVFKDEPKYDTALLLDEQEMRQAGYAEWFAEYGR